MEYLFKFIAIWFACLFKFIAGPVLGSAANYNLFEIVMVTVLGMMSSVVIITYLGEWLKTIYKPLSPRSKFSKRKRTIVRTWQKFGPAGIAALTPIILTPIGGTFILTAFNVQKKKIFGFMFISSLVWSLILGSSIHWLLTLPLFDFLLR